LVTSGGDESGEALQQKGRAAPLFVEDAAATFGVEQKSTTLKSESIPWQAAKPLAKGSIGFGAVDFCEILFFAPGHAIVWDILTALCSTLPQAVNAAILIHRVF
jgi:hypothetical protein